MQLLPQGELGGGSKAAWHMGHVCSVRHRQCHLLCFSGRLQGNLTTACHSRMLPKLDPRDLSTPTFSHPDCSYLTFLPFRLLLYNNEAPPSENEGRQHRLLLFLRSKRLRTDLATSSPPPCPLDAPCHREAISPPRSSATRQSLETRATFSNTNHAKPHLGSKAAHEKQVNPQCCGAGHKHIHAGGKDRRTLQSYDPSKDLKS